MYVEAMTSLQKIIKELVEDELVENMLLKGSQVPSDEPGASGDIDDIMRSIMGPRPAPPFDLHPNDMVTDDEIEAKSDPRPLLNGLSPIFERSRAGKGKDKAM
jgi:hypothetical protein